MDTAGIQVPRHSLRQYDFLQRHVSQRGLGESRRLQSQYDLWLGGLRSLVVLDRARPRGVLHSRDLVFLQATAGFDDHADQARARGLFLRSIIQEPPQVVCRQYGSPAVAPRRFSRTAKFPMVENLQIAAPGYNFLP